MTRPVFRQVIRPGQSGSDVKAVKLAYRRLGVVGAGSMATTKRAGPAFVKVTKTFQRHHGLKVDGIYGKSTHAKLIDAKKWTLWMIALYRTATIRKPTQPPSPPATAQSAAKLLLKFHAEGKYRADNPGDLRDIEATAEGKAVWSQGGYYVHIDKRVLDALVWLIEHSFKIGTFAICSDHHNDGPHGHAGGLAVDISSINGVAVSAHIAEARELTLKVAKLLHERNPWQEICDGYGYVYDPAISACTIPSAAFYGYTTMSEHRNHIHVGFH